MTRFSKKVGNATERKELKILFESLQFCLKLNI